MRLGCGRFEVTVQVPQIKTDRGVEIKSGRCGLDITYTDPALGTCQIFAAGHYGGLPKAKDSGLASYYVIKAIAESTQVKIEQQSTKQVIERFYRHAFNEKQRVLEAWHGLLVNSNEVMSKHLAWLRFNITIMQATMQIAGFPSSQILPLKAIYKILNDELNNLTKVQREGVFEDCKNNPLKIQDILRKVRELQALYEQPLNLQFESHLLAMIAKGKSRIQGFKIANQLLSATRTSPTQDQNRANADEEEEEAESHASFCM